jgi:hypothetical protein
MKRFYRPTTLGLALAEAAIKAAPKVEHANESNWITRRVLGNLDREHIGVVSEASTNAHLSFKTAQQLKKDGVL